jgi:regulator of sirC expression with transglutaminase-like and TPR domain
MKNLAMGNPYAVEFEPIVKRVENSISKVKETGLISQAIAIAQNNETVRKLQTLLKSSSLQQNEMVTLLRSM